MNDTIAAMATPAIPCAIGILRISGSDAKDVLLKVFKPMGRLRPRRMIFGKVFSANGKQIDEGLAVFMPGPGSYTGEDTAEIYCHGSPGVLAAVLNSLFAAGARQALPGEYTRRAFLNGRIDLSQSEAVIDLIDSETEAAAANAAAQLGGVLGKKLSAVRDSLIEMAVQLSAQIDFPDEEVPELFMPDAAARLEEAAVQIENLRRSYACGALIKNGVSTAITGRPNVGKSSLLNALAGFDRAIVTDIPGTTRDVIEQNIVLNGVKFVFSDTAGIRSASDAVEKIGVDRAEEAVRQASAVIAVFDGSEELCPEDMRVLENIKGRENVFCVINKCDLPRKIDIGRLSEYRIFPVSAADGTGLAELSQALSESFDQNTEGWDSMITNPRQEDALRRAAEAVRRGINAANTLTADVMCTDIEDAAEILGEITGQTASAEIIDSIFSRFCVGK